MKGSRFEEVYSFCSITFGLLTIFHSCLVIGAWQPHARLAGICCTGCLCLVSFAAWIMTAVYRFNKMGKLSALSLAPSKFDDGSINGYFDMRGRTYADDAHLIVAIWIAHFFSWCLHAPLSYAFNRRPSKDERARMHTQSIRDYEHSILGGDDGRAGTPD